MTVVVGSVACPICGASGKACGPTTDPTPVDLPEMENNMSGELNEYEITTASGYVTTVQMNDEDAKAHGLGPLATSADSEDDEKLVTSGKAAAPPANKARTGQNK